MRYAQRVWSWLLQRGRLSPASYRLLTGVAMLVVANAVWSARDTDALAGPVGLLLLVTGIVTGGRGLQQLAAHRAASRDNPSRES